MLFHLVSSISFGEFIKIKIKKIIRQFEITVSLRFKISYILLQWKKEQ